MSSSVVAVATFLKGHGSRCMTKKPLPLHIIQQQRPILIVNDHFLRKFQKNHISQTTINTFSQHRKDHVVVAQQQQRRFLRTEIDPGKLIHGITKERMLEDSDVEAFLKANFPHEFEEEQDEENIASLETLLEMERKEQALKEMQERESKKKFPLNIRPLSCYLRDAKEEEGSRVSQKLRRNGMIPGIIHGGDPTKGILSHQPESKMMIKTPWNLLDGELSKYHRHFESRVYNLTVLETPEDTEGPVHRVIPQSVQRHPVKDTIYCANFCRYHAGKPLKLPVLYINQEESPALKRGSFVLPINKYVECIVEDGAAIPEILEVECTGLKHKEVIRKDRILVPDGVRYSKRVMAKGDEFILGVVFGKRYTAEDEENVEE